MLRCLSGLGGVRWDSGPLDGRWQSRRRNLRPLRLGGNTEGVAHALSRSFRWGQSKLGGGPSGDFPRTELCRWSSVACRRGRSERATQAVIVGDPFAVDFYFDAAELAVGCIFVRIC